MSNSPLVSYTKLSPNHSGKRKHAIDTISIHCMAGNLSVERCGELFRSWGKAVRYIKSHDLADLSDLIENDLIEPEYAGYIPADNPCCPGERCCEYAERIEREYTAEREADEDNEDADVFEYDGEPAISELTGVCRDILTAVEGLTSLLRDEFDYAG